MKLPTRVLANPALSDRAIRLYGVLANYQGAKAYGWALRSTLAGVLGCSVKSVDRASRQLIDAGELQITQRTGPDGSLISSLYALRTELRDTGDATLGTPVTLGRDTGDAENQTTRTRPLRTTAVSSDLEGHQSAEHDTSGDDFDVKTAAQTVRHAIRSNR